jgi:transcription elongation GreA/GreB family factor
MSYLFLQKDFEALKAKAKQLEKESEKLGKKIRETTTESSESWHDNAPFDTVMQELGMLKKQLEEIGKLIRKAKIVQPSEDNNKVGIGNIVKVIDGESKERWYQIGSYRIMAVKTQKGRNSEKNPLIISYTSPIGQKLLNKKQGEEIEVDLLTKTSILTIEEIKNK